MNLRSHFSTRELNSREFLHVWKLFLDTVGVSCGAFWTKIGGNQAETFPNLPIYPRTLDCYKKTKKAKEKFRKSWRLVAFERI